MFETYSEIFQQRADSYHEAMREQPHARREEFAAAVACLDLFPEALLCDIPAGGGYLSHYVPERTQCLFAETSRFFADRCPRNSRFRVLQSSIELLPIADRALDRLLSLAALHHVDNKMSAIEEFARVLRPGGVAVAADVEVDTGTAGFLNEFVNRYNSMGHVGRFLDQEFYDGIGAQGMTAIETRKPALGWHFPDCEAMARFCTKLFGLDLAKPADVLAGINDYLGFEEREQSVVMNWQLSYAVMRSLPGSAG